MEIQAGAAQISDVRSAITDGDGGAALRRRGTTA